MKFTFPNADLSKVIKRFTYEGNYFHVEYFDGSKCDYYCSDPYEESKIKNIMLNQAKERQKKMDNPHDKAGELMSLYAELILILGLQDNIKNGRDIMTYLCAIILIVNSDCQVHWIKEMIELKKFAMFLEMYESLDEINKTEFMKCIEFEPIYQRPLDIDTVDDFSYGDIKTLYRKFKQEKTNL